MNFNKLLKRKNSRQMRKLINKKSNRSKSP